MCFGWRRRFDWHGQVRVWSRFPAARRGGSFSGSTVCAILRAWLIPQWIRFGWRRRVSRFGPFSESNVCATLKAWLFPPWLRAWLVACLGLVLLGNHAEGQPLSELKEFRVPRTLWACFIHGGARGERARAGLGAKDPKQFDPKQLEPEWQRRRARGRAGEAQKNLQEKRDIPPTHPRYTPDTYIPDAPPMHPRRARGLIVRAAGAAAIGMAIAQLAWPLPKRL